MLHRIIQLSRVRPWRWWFVLTGLFLAGMVLVWSLPAIVGSGLVWPRVIAYLSSDLEGEIATEEVTLGWFAPVVVRNVNVEDMFGEAVATVGAIRTESTLLSLLLGGSNFGNIVIEQPRLQLSLRPDGSNLEDLLAPYLTESESSTDVTGSFSIKNGTLTVKTPHRPELAPRHFDSVNAVINLSGGSDAGGVVDIQSCHLAGGVSDGSLAARMTWRRAGDAHDWSVAAKVRSFDLSLLQSLAERSDVAIALQGTGDLTGRASWQGSSRRMTVELQRAALHDLQLRAPGYLGDDELQFEHVVTEGICRVTDEAFQVTGATVRCDAGELAMDGECAWPIATGGSLRRLAALARTATVQVQGQLDLAELAATLPNTLHIREGSVIESGSMDFLLQGKNESGEQRWRAQVETGKLEARRDGRRFTWNSPLQITVSASQKADTWSVQELTCASSFLSFNGNATPTSGSFELECDLQHLSAQLREFVDLGALRAAGTMSAQLSWQADTNSRFTINATSLLENLELDSGATGHWQERRLSATLTVEGEQGEEQVPLIRTAELALASRDDRLELQLLEPLEAPGPNAAWLVGCYVNGQWSTWLPRLRLFLPSSIPSHAWTATGLVDVQAALRISKQGVEIEHMTIASEPFMLDSPQLRIEEPAIKLELQGGWDFEARRLRMPEGIFQSPALAVRLTDVRIGPGDSGTTGELTFRADLDRLYNAWRLPDKQQDWRLSGSAQGQISLIQPGEAIEARWTIDLVGLEVERRQLSAPGRTVIPATNSASWVAVWREPVLNFTGSGQINLQPETVVLDRFDLKSADKLHLSLHGSLAQPVGPCVVDLEGQVTYDLAKLLQHWIPSSYEQVRWTGRDTQPFSLHGPLFHLPDRAAAGGGRRASPSTAGMIPPKLTGNCGLSWQSADLLGIAIGAGAATAKLEGGTVQVGIVETPMSGGTLRIEPAVHLNHHPPMISIAPAQVLTDVQITAGMCDRWLKYVTPVVASATRAEGQFSASVEQAAIPLRQPTAARVSGTLHVHSARIGPGPLAQHLVLLANNLRSLLQLQLDDFSSLGQDSWVTLPQQQIRCQIANRRVHHDQLTFMAGGITMHTNGSVGFDQSLDLMVQIPVQEKWIASNPRLGTLRDHIIQVPISGTLNRPRLDRRNLERLATDTLRQATGHIIENELRKGLQHWLNPDQ